MLIEKVEVHLLLIREIKGYSKMNVDKDVQTTPVQQTIVFDIFPRIGLF